MGLNVSACAIFPVMSTVLNKLTQDTKRVCELSTIHFSHTNTRRHVLHQQAFNSSEKSRTQVGTFSSIICRGKSHRCQVDVTFQSCKLQPEKKQQFNYNISLVSFQLQYCKSNMQSLRNCKKPVMLYC